MTHILFIFFSFFALPSAYVCKSAQILYITDWIYFKIFYFFVFGFVLNKILHVQVCVRVCLMPQMILFLSFLFLYVFIRNVWLEQWCIGFAQEFFCSLFSFQTSFVEIVYSMKEKCTIYYDKMLDCLESSMQWSFTVLHIKQWVCKCACTFSLTCTCYRKCRSRIKWASPSENGDFNNHRGVKLNFFIIRTHNRIERKNKN